MKIKRQNTNSAHECVGFWCGHCSTVRWIADSLFLFPYTRTHIHNAVLDNNLNHYRFDDCPILILTQPIDHTQFAGEPPFDFLCPNPIIYLLIQMYAITDYMIRDIKSNDCWKCPLLNENLNKWKIETLRTKRIKCGIDWRTHFKLVWHKCTQFVAF